MNVINNARVLEESNFIKNPILAVYGDNELFIISKTSLNLIEKISQIFFDIKIFIVSLFVRISTNPTDINKLKDQVNAFYEQKALQLEKSKEETFLKLNNNIDDATKRLENVKSLITEQEKALSTIKKEQQNYEGLLNSSKDKYIELKTLAANEEKLRRSIVSSNDTISSLNAVITSLSSQRQELQKSIQSLNSEKNQLEETISSKRNQDYISRCHQAEVALAVAETQLSHLKHSINELTIKNRSLEQSYKEVSASYRNEQKALEHAISKHDYVVSRCKALNKEINELKGRPADYTTKRDSDFVQPYMYQRMTMMWHFNHY